MRTIYKYRVEVGNNKVDMPVGAVLRHFATQEVTINETGRVGHFTELCVWAEVETLAPFSARLLAVLPTGVSVPGDEDDAEYVGSCLDRGLVWHCYDGGEVSP